MRWQKTPLVLALLILSNYVHGNDHGRAPQAPLAHENCHLALTGVRTSVFIKAAKVFELPLHIATIRFGPAVRTVWFGLQELGYEDLIIDSGIVMHFKEFDSFVKANPSLRGADAWTAREAFKKFLGYRRVYRAAYLSTEEHNKILSLGLQSTAVSLGKDEYQLLRQRIVDQIRARVDNATSETDPLLSVSDYPELAMAVCALQAGSPHTLDRHPYLLTIKIPELDLLYLRIGESILESYLAENYILYFQVTTPNGVLKVPFGNRASESFIFHSIAPDEIEALEMFDPQDYKREWLDNQGRNHEHDDFSLYVY